VPARDGGQLWEKVDILGQAAGSAYEILKDDAGIYAVNRSEMTLPPRCPTRPSVSLNERLLRQGDATTDKH